MTWLVEMDGKHKGTLTYTDDYGTVRIEAKTFKPSKIYVGNTLLGIYKYEMEYIKKRAIKLMNRYYWSKYTVHRVNQLEIPELLLDNIFIEDGYRIWIKTKYGIGLIVPLGSKSKVFFNNSLRRKDFKMISNSSYEAKTQLCNHITAINKRRITADYVKTHQRRILQEFKASITPFKYGVGE